MICRMRNPSTAIYHLFQYDLSFCIFCSTEIHKAYTEIHKVILVDLCGSFVRLCGIIYLMYLLLLFAIKFANSRYAPGTPAGSSRKNTSPA